ncbi:MULTISPECIES: transglutaminase-like cysteine peptidase [Pseudoalteromonas]|uniref:Transglutaminase-like cysteine peptidase n=2 Tax=Pseudoalteromonas TaxID=53246 RepID=A0ABW8L3D0_9GAMM|nr:MULTISPECIES: transglutaminase-like cysteine peptidase [unclassified Pseudoalteromonas]MBB1343816.1 transglutaminase-like cysteine peptidase [Pseudoalteromonas sp. SR45-6]MBB1419467.1 transglutaminase-like cysteine peptidase [Pseudoalteromonas sp. SG44-1]MBB1479229.1 transglutaminase-like cysteine peptidase [Pseudoalteromonas sp. SG41-2]
MLLRKFSNCPLLHFALLFILVTSVVFADRLPIQFNVFLEKMNLQFGPTRVAVARNWQTMLVQSQNQTEQQKILIVNDFFARNLRYRTDIELWQQNDYWATPLETLGKGLGDCEDYAIAKYISLRVLGIEDDKLRLIYVKAQIGGPNSKQTQAHMVLGYFVTPNAQPLILDSLITKVLPAAKRTDLSPVFSFNSQGLWANNSTQSVANPTARLSRWRRIIEQTQQEGIIW